MLSGFTSAGQIDTWAKDALTHLVETGAIGGGSGGNPNSASTTTRAETARGLYDLLMKA